MTELLPDLVFQSALRTPDAPALSFGDKTLSYGELAGQIRQSAASFVRMGIGKSERVAIYLEKRLENVVAMFGAAAAGAVFVPVNPLLRPQQVRHILRDCNVRILVTSESRLASLSDILSDCPDLNSVVSVDGPPAAELAHIDGLGWSDLFEKAS
ncbi:MAG: AMP-binding protein, partial [Rhodospirillaceae bacterium]|nr:AMP-binding protein [Rhodospirillaceae bacterium]